MVREWIGILPHILKVLVDHLSVASTEKSGWPEMSSHICW